MVDAITLNGETGEAPARVELPEIVHLAAEEARRIPSPGAQRALKAETGFTWDQLTGPDADGADRAQTLVWMRLRRDHPGLRWAECDEVAIQVDEGLLELDPTKLAGSTTSPPSADSGG